MRVSTRIAFEKIPDRDWIRREDWEAVNRNFEKLDRAFALGFQYINLGKVPNDATADSIREGIRKVNHNFALIDRWMDTIVQSVTQ